MLDTKKPHEKLGQAGVEIDLDDNGNGDEQGGNPARGQVFGLKAKMRMRVSRRAPIITRWNLGKPEDGRFHEEMLPFGAVLHGAVARSLPTSFFSLGCLFIILGVPLTSRTANPVWLWGATMAVALTVGYLLGSEILRRHFRPVAGIAGWRSMLAGLMSPLPFFLVGSLGSPLPTGTALALMVTGGIVLAFAAYFVRRTSDRRRM